MSEPTTRRHHVRRATAGALTAAIVAILALATINTSDDRCDAMPATRCDRVFADFSSSQLATTNDGTPLGVYDNGGNTSGLAVVDSRLTHGAPLTRNAAGYLEARMGAPVTRIGAIASFHSSNSGAIGLISWASSVVETRKSGPSARLPNGSMHFAASNNDWIFSLWDSARNTTDTLLQGPLMLAADGTRYAFEVIRDGDRVTVRLPDGTTQSATDPRIGKWSGPWASWELYEPDPTRVPASIDAIWAS